MTEPKAEEPSRCTKQHPFSGEQCKLPAGHEGHHELDQGSRTKLSDEEQHAISKRCIPDLREVCTKWRAEGIPWDAISAVFFSQYMVSCWAAGRGTESIMRNTVALLNIGLQDSPDGAMVALLTPHDLTRPASDGTNAPGGAG